MSKRAGIAVGVSIGLLAAGQAVALFVLGARRDVPVDPISDGVLRHMAYTRGAFHLLGTLLAAPWLAALPSLAPLGRWPRLLFGPWLVSAVSWFAWAARGLPMPDRSGALYGVVGVVVAALVGATSLVVFARRYVRVPAERPVARRGLALAVLVLLWTCAFAAAQIVAGISA